MTDGFLRSGHHRNFLIVTGDTYSKLIHDDDRATSKLFGDGVAATLVASSNPGLVFRDAEFFTSGQEGSRFMVANGGARNPIERCVVPPEQNPRDDYIAMDGLGILSFFNTKLPIALDSILQNQLTIDKLKLIVPHQASKLAISGLVRAYPGHEDKFVIDMADTGNLTSASIPVALQKIMSTHQLSQGDNILLIGFGVGLSWSTVLLEANHVEY